MKLSCCSSLDCQKRLLILNLFCYIVEKEHIPLFIGCCNPFTFYLFLINYNHNTVAVCNTVKKCVNIDGRGPNKNFSLTWEVLGGWSHPESCIVHNNTLCKEEESNQLSVHGNAKLDTEGSGGSTCLENTIVLNNTMHEGGQSNESSVDGKAQLLLNMEGSVGRTCPKPAIVPNLTLCRGEEANKCHFYANTGWWFVCWQQCPKFGLCCRMNKIDVPDDNTRPQQSIVAVNVDSVVESLASISVEDFIWQESIEPMDLENGLESDCDSYYGDDESNYVNNLAIFLETIKMTLLRLFVRNLREKWYG